MILAIDVGGTKMAAGLVARDGTVAASRLAATPRDADAAALWATLADLIEPLSGGAEGVGVGCGGPMTWPAGEVSPLNIPGWRGFPLRARLAGRFPGYRYASTTTPSAWPWPSTGRAPAGGAPPCWAWWCPRVWAAG
ncbi:hypothetical protein GCM10022419_069240 [Nonomuraea rosea]|uniref:ROK family protein n=1 Tax=Nonomuraea rosea TaxID=638574 RepID=A0ABP6Y7Y6_9ACTN